MSTDDTRKGREVSDAVLQLLRALEDRHGKAVVLGGVAHAVGTYCDAASPTHKFYMAADIAGWDPDVLLKRARARARGLIV